MAETTALEDVTALVTGELARVRARVAEALAPESAELAPLIAHVGGYQGKLLRPAICLLAGRALRGLRDAHYEVAAILEMIHTATLVHDDILDGALVRRKLASLHALYGSDVSVLLGDYIYAKAFHMSIALADQRCSRSLSAITRTICQGEITQMLHRADLGLSEETYLRIIGEKTASLYGAAGELGAHYAGGGPEVVARFERFGYDLGMAFQIIDDCLDVEGEEEVVGKSLGTDFGKGKLTLPFLKLLEGLDATGRRRFAELFGRGDRVEDALAGAERQRALLREFDLEDGLTYAHERANSYLRSALDALASLRRPGSLGCDEEALEALAATADFVLHRKS